MESLTVSFVFNRDPVLVTYPFTSDILCSLYTSTSLAHSLQPPVWGVRAFCVRVTSLSYRIGFLFDGHNVVYDTGWENMALCRGQSRMVV